MDETADNHVTSGATRPLVSVVMNFLDEERFLGEAVESVRARQTWTDWELLLVDDGSTDGSTALARSFAEAEPTRVRYIDHPGHQNRGPGASRNLGVAHARGEWIALLDGDDVWLPDKLRCQLELTRQFPTADFVYGAGCLWSSWDPDTDDPDLVLASGFDEPTLFEPPDIFTEWYSKQRIPYTGAVLFRPETHATVGGFEEGFRGLQEDNVFYLKIALHARILAHPDVTMRYRQHPDGTCMVEQRTGTVDASNARFRRWADAYLEEVKGEDAPSFSKVIRQGFYAARMFERAYARRHAAQP